MHLQALMLCLWLCNCRHSPSQKVATSFKQDSLQIRHLVHIGDSVYAQRSSVGTIAQSLPYFDSAYRIAQRLNDVDLLASTMQYIGNVYNAWNGEPKTTIKYYSQSAQLFGTLPSKQQKSFYLRYMVAHAWDPEKAADSAECVKVLQEALVDLQLLPDTVINQFIFVSDYAWVATNVKAYRLAETFLQLVPRGKIFNDPESNNYLDHYYLSKARIEIYGDGKKQSLYIDSLEMALSKCKNRYDSTYYTTNLSLLFQQIKELNTALYYSRISEALRSQLGDVDVLSVLRQELLTRDLKYEREQQRTIAARLRANNILLIGAILVALLVALMYYLYQKRKNDIARRKSQEAFTRLLLQKEEDERRRLASDLHDGINHELLALKNNLLQGNSVTSADVDDVMTTIREVSRNLYPVMFETVGLQASVQALCERATASGFFTSCDLTYLPLLTKDEELQVYRIIQESLTNISKHANAEAAKITIDTTERIFKLEIKDNGKGFDVAKVLTAGYSFGLQSAQQRAAAIGASLNIKSAVTGTIISLTKTIKV